MGESLEDQADTQSVVMLEESSGASNNSVPFTFLDGAVAPLPWHRYSQSFKWLWPACPKGNCKKAKPAVISKKSEECSADFYYGIQGCGKLPGTTVTWTNPITDKIETSQVGCNCRGAAVKTVFYGTVNTMKDKKEATQLACASNFNKWSQEVRTTLENWESKLSGLSREVARKCSPTYPVLQ